MSKLDDLSAHGQPQIEQGTGAGPASAAIGCEEDAELEEVIELHRQSVQRDPNCAESRKLLADLLIVHSRLDEAIGVLDQSGKGRLILDWLHDKLTVAMRETDLTLAGKFARVLADVQWGRAMTPQSIEKPSPSFPVTAAKLRHDADQFDFLASRGILDSEHGDLSAQYRAVAEMLDARSRDARIPLENDEFRALWPTYNRLLHIRPTPRVSRAISNHWDAQAVEAQYLDVPPGIVVIDEFLTRAALQELREFCLESTVWFANRYGHGRLGAFIQDGFSCPLLLQIAEELRAVLPRVIGNRYPLR